MTLANTTQNQVGPPLEVSVSNEVATLPRRLGREIIGIRFPNKEAVHFALLIAEESYRLQDEYNLTISEVKDLFFEVCETFPKTMLDWYRRLYNDRDANWDEFALLHAEGKSIDYIIRHFRRKRVAENETA